MSENKHVYELIGKDPFNIKLLNDTLWDIKESIYGNLYDAQRTLADITRFDFDMSNMAKRTKTECTYHIDLQFITNRSRINYKQSKFYKKHLTPDEINSNPNIFDRNIYVFINGEMYTNFHVVPIENITAISFKIFEQCPYHPPGVRYIHTGFTRFEMDELINSKALMTVLVVKSHNVSYLQSNLGTIRNYTVVPKYNGIPLVNFASFNGIGLTDNFMTWITTDDTKLYKYRFIGAVKNDNKLKLDEGVITALTNTFVDIRNIFFLNYLTTVSVVGNTFFELPIKDMPIPVENFIIFRKTDTGIYFDHTTKITLHYPNMYEVETDHNDELLIYAYYSDDTKALGSKYQNELALYYRFTTNILSKYKNGTIPDIIKTYKPITMSYDHTDLHSSRLDHLNYKFNKLNSLIGQNGNYYSIYLHKLIGYVPTFTINVSEIDDLSSRYRVDNLSEIKEIGKMTKFDSPCYLFTFRHNRRDSINILIDSYYINDMHVFYDSKYCFVYIPVQYIKPDTIITVEKFVNYRYKQTITIADIYTYHKIDLPEDKYIQLSDIYVTTKTDNGDSLYLSKNDYKLYVYLDGGYREVTSNDFYNYKKIYIKFINPMDSGKVVDINVTRVSFKQVVTGTNEIVINREINNDKRNILLYRNGRLVPFKLRKYMFNDISTGPHVIKASMIQNPTDEYTLVYNSNKYFMVYYQRKINDRGIVDLTGKINKPLDLKWYDIYLNGLKLNASNIEIIAPYIFIVKGIPTLTNLEIYQKNLDSLSWNNNYPTDDISSKIFDEIIGDIESQYPEIEDTIPDLFKDIVVEIEEFFNEYLWSYIRLINPDTLQITQSMVDKYPTLCIESGNNLFLNPDSLYITEKNILMNPDTNTVLVT